MAVGVERYIEIRMVLTYVKFVLPQRAVWLVTKEETIPQSVIDFSHIYAFSREAKPFQNTSTARAK